MNRFVQIALTAGLLGMFVLGCAKPKEAAPEQRIVTMEEAAQMQKQADASRPPQNLPPQGRQGGASGPQPKQKIGAAAPETVGHDLSGKEVKLSDLKGKVVVLDFWATWCPPCRGMIPNTNELFDKMSGKPLVIVSVSADQKKEALADFLKTNKMPWTHWWDGASGPVATLWGVQGYPTIYVVDHKGIIRHHQVGAGPGLDAVVENLVKEAEGSSKS